MRKIINSSYVTLDGVVDGPHTWPALPGGAAKEHEEVQLALLEQCDTLLMGRRTYDVFAGAWPERSGDPVADRPNSMREPVASTTLQDAAWANTEVVADGLAERISALKAESGGHIVQYGIGPVTHLMVREGLLDELHLWLYPQFVRAGAGDLVFDRESRADFDLPGSRTLRNGVVVLRHGVLTPWPVPPPACSFRTGPRLGEGRFPLPPPGPESRGFPFPVRCGILYVQQIRTSSAPAPFLMPTRRLA
ncbi:dihydrofolate reductase family protein [Streptomyces sp. CMB-StM0423]|uniref:dihydrofolate reductase family protein n=1 Tax=Streptomyces sp. CMB-StM0423 TaxID=2059884 RepID=UPI00131E7674|nr:dihydrofolate reductase family protein [Streptomyces sp. CMB-StM0423]